MNSCIAITDCKTDLIMPSAMVGIYSVAGFSGPPHLVCGSLKKYRCEDAYMFIYTVKQTKPFRKMGHVTILDDDIDSLKESELCKQTLRNEYADRSR